MNNSFKEYLEEKEEQDIGLQLDENFAQVAGSVLGYSTAGLLVSWAGYLIIKGYASLMKRAITGIVKAWKGIFGRTAKANEATQAIQNMRRSQPVKVAEQKSKQEAKQYDEKLDEVFSAIAEKDPKKAYEKLKDSGVTQSPVVNRVIIGEVVRVLGEPPLHYGNTGNEAYLFVKTILGIKVAQSTAMAVKEALKAQSSDLIQNVDEQ